MNFGTHIWHNGTLIPTEDSKVHSMSHATHYGTGAFEGVRFYSTDRGPAVFKLKEHTKRLFYSVGTIEMEIPYSQEEINQATLETISANGFSDGYIRPIAFYGADKLGLNPTGNPVETVIAVMPWGKYLSDDPIEVGLSPYVRIHPKSLICDAKISGHYVNSTLSNQWAKKNNYHEALLLDFEDNLAEGPGENLFLVKDGKLMTPQLGSILPGITRATIMELAKEEFGIETLEKTLKLKDLLEADEAFYTGTAAEVTLIKSLDREQIGDQSNLISTKLKQLYGDVVTGKVEKYHDWLSFVN